MSAADDRPIVLVFPPLVSSNLGCYYPSTAVLAGALAAHGYRSRQIELNEALAAICLEDAALARASEGELIEGRAPDSMRRRRSPHACSTDRRIHSGCRGGPRNG
jgi:hypothetical protein